MVPRGCRFAGWDGDRLKAQRIHDVDDRLVARDGDGQVIVSLSMLRLK